MLVEAVLVLPLFVIGVLGALQLATIQRARILTEYAAFNAARAGIVWSGNAERMLEAATISLLPAMGRTDDLVTLARTRAEFEVVDRAFRLLPWGTPDRAPDALPTSRMKGMIRVETLSPGAGESESDWEELEFDAPPAKGAPDGSTLTVRVRYFHELKVPLANAAVFSAWRRLVLWKDDAQVTRGELAVLSGAAAAGRYYLPLFAEYSMRMQSNFHRKWWMPERTR